MPAVFISYSRRDKAFVQRLHGALAARDYDVWVDWEDIPASAEWFEEIRAGVGAADGFIYVISPDSVSSEVCTRELDHALEQHKRVVPVVCREPNGTAVPEAAAALNWIFLRESDDFQAGFDRLVSALETDLDHVRVHTRLGVQAARWESSGRDRSQLLRGSELAAAEGWLVTGAGKAPEATQLQREYLLASRQASTRRQRSVIGAVSVALIVAVVLAIVALVQRSNAVHESNVAFAHQLDAQAQANLSTDPELSILLAVKAAHTVAGSEAETMLRLALSESQVRIRYQLGDPGGDVIWSPNGRRLLVTSPGPGSEAFARIYIPGSNAPPVSLPGPGDHASSGFDAAGDRVIIGGGRPAVYNAATGQSIRRFPGSALHAALSPDGTRVVTVDVFWVGHVFDIATGRSLATFTPHLSGGVTCFALSPDGRYAAQCDATTLATLGAPGSLDIWDTATGRLVRSIPTVDVIGTVSFSPDSSEVAFSVSATVPHSVAAHATSVQLGRYLGYPGTFVYETTGNGKAIKAFAEAGSAVAFSPNPTYPALAYATLSGTAYVYSFLSHRLIPLAGATDTIELVAFDPTGGYVVTGGRDRTLRIYTTTAGGNPIETLAGHKGDIVAAGFGEGDKYVASSSTDGTARVWQGPTPIPSVQRADPDGDGHVPGIAPTPDGTRIIVPGQGHTPSGQGRILAATDLHTLATFSAPPGQVFVGVGVSRDGRRLIAGSGTVTNGVVTRVDAVESFSTRTGARLATMAPSGGRSIIAAQPDYLGNRLVELELGGIAEMWDTRTGKLLRTFTGANTVAAAAGFTRDGNLLAIAHYPTLPAQVTYKTIYGHVFVQLYDSASGHLLRTIEGPTLTNQVGGEASYAPLSIAFSPNGRYLAFSGANPTVSIVDPSTGRPAHPPLTIQGLTAGSYVNMLVFSPDGRTLAAGSSSGAYLWRVPLFNSPPAILQHVAPGTTSSLVGGGVGVRLGFTGDSRNLVTVGALTLVAWNVADRLQLQNLYPVGTGNLDLGGTKLVSANGDGISVYPCTLCGGLPQLLALAKHRVTRGFTADETAQLLKRG